MKAIILAAGRGSRMGDGTKLLPKCMTVFQGKALIERCVDTLCDAGFQRRDIGIVTGYRSECINVEGVNYFHNKLWECTNMFASLVTAAEWLKNEPCIVCYSDIVFHMSIVEELKSCKADIAITYYTEFWKLWSRRFENPLDDLETFIMNNGKLVEIGNKPHTKDEVQGQYMGILRFTPSGWRDVEEAIKKPMPKPVERLDMTTLLQHMITLGHEITVIPTEKLWLEFDNQEDVRVYEREFAQFL